MTRGEKINNAKNIFYKRILEEGSYYDPRDCFEEGAEWADTHPKSPWISVDDDLPCYHEELTHSNYTNRVLIAAKNGFVEVAFMSKIENVWVWEIPIKVTHWMPMPGLPK